MDNERLRKIVLWEWDVIKSDAPSIEVIEVEAGKMELSHLFAPFASSKGKKIPSDFQTQIFWFFFFIKFPSLLNAQTVLKLRTHP